jgi:delta 1-pyrroline-5-carboxylate dehydrogenase
VLATSDVPAGVANLLTGSAEEIGPWLASHLDVNGIDLAGVDDPDLARSMEEQAADNLKRVRRPQPGIGWEADPDLSAMTAFLETKTVWHPIGI